MSSVRVGRKFINVVGSKIRLVPRSEIPPTTIEQINGSAPQFISFPAEFKCWALDFVVDNLSAVNMTFRVNEPLGSGAIKTLVPGGAFSASDQIVVSLEIVTGTNWEVTFSRVPLEEGEG